jgi:hypothetical protein
VIFAENSAEFVEKMIFQNFFGGKLQFFWEKIFRGIFRGKNVRKIGPRTNLRKLWRQDFSFKIVATNKALSPDIALQTDKSL